MGTDGGWTLDDLVRLVEEALAGAAYPGAPNGRVRDVPDRRAVRWYTTIGLVDRPVTGAGRTARYGPRHLLQLVAVKRRQAQGRTLAEIQAELAGATDATLRRVAGLAEDRLAAAAGDARRPSAPGDPAADQEAPRDPAADQEAPAASVAGQEAAPPAPGADRARSADPGRSRFWAQRPVAAPFSLAPDHVAEVPAATLTGVPLSSGVVLLVPGRPDANDLLAIHAAARPLLTLLAERGLLADVPDGSST